MKNLKDILEASLLADIKDTIETGNKYEKVDLTSIFNSKSKDEFETKFNIFRSMVEEKNTEVSDIKPRKTYIVFVKNISMKSKDTRLCRVSIFIGTTNDLYRITWTKDDITGKDRMTINKMETISLDHFVRKYNYLESAIYICPKKIKDEANKLIIYNLE
jgi:hypothetical protein